MLTSNDFWPPPKTIGCFYSMWYTCIPNMSSVQASLPDIVFTRFSQFDPCWPQMTFDLHQKQKASFTQCGTPIYQIWALSKLSLLGYRVYKVFTIWPLLTPNDLWPPPKTKGFFYSMWYTYIPNMSSVQAFLVEISCLQGFHNLTPVDPKWPLTSTKINRLLVLNVVHLHTKYEICPSFPTWDIVFTRF